MKFDYNAFRGHPKTKLILSWMMGAGAEVPEILATLDPSDLDIEIKVNGFAIPMGTFFKLAESSDGVAFKKSKVLFYRANEESVKLLSSITAEKLIGLRDGLVDAKVMVGGVNTKRVLDVIRGMRRVADEGYAHALNAAANENRYCYDKIIQGQKHFNENYDKYFVQLKDAMSVVKKREAMNKVGADLDKLIAAAAFD